MDEAAFHFELHAVVSKTQAGALRELLRSAKLAADEVAEVVLVASKLKWQNFAHFTFATSTLSSEAADVAASQRRRRVMQDWVALPAYFSKTLWDLLASDVGPAGKLDAILQFGARGGLRLPSEGTIKTLTTVWLLVTQEDCVDLTFDQKLVYLKHVKGRFASIRKKMGDAIAHIESLPGNPCEFATCHPAVYEAWFVNDKNPGSMPPKFLQRLRELDESYGCRSSKKPELKANGNPMVDMMQALMTNQSKLFQIALGQAASSTNPSIELLTQPSDHSLPACLRPMRSEGLAFPIQPLALQNAAVRRAVTLEDLTPSPDKTLATSAIAYVAPSASSPPPSSLPSTLPPSIAADGEPVNALADIASFLDARAARKQPAPAPGPAKRKADPEENNKSGAKGKAKAKAKAESKSNDSPADKGEKASNFKNAAKASEDHAGKGAKAKDSGNSEKKVLSEKSAGKGDGKKYAYGCSKCRWERGCSRCKDPNFKGVRFSIYL